MLKLTGFIAAISLALTPLPLMPAEPENMVIVLDASNSMWGQINDHHKIEIARTSLTNLLHSQSEQTKITLVTYGNQRKSDCNDISVIASSKPSEVLQQVVKIIPKGRSPISTAINQAATISNHILLISDGKESCNADPCITAEQLKKSDPTLKINVAGFTTKPDVQLQCIADNTGGKYVLASDTKALAQLLSPSTISTSSVVAKASGSTPIPPDTPGTLGLTLGAGDDPTNLQGSFLLYDANDNHISSFTARKEVSLPLSPGKYRVDVLWRQMKLSEQLTVLPGKTTTYRFDLGSMGTLILEAVDSQHQPLDVNFTLYTKDDDYLSEHLLKSSVKEQLPTGLYRIKAYHDGQTLEVNAEVTPSGELHHTFVFSTSH